MTHTGVSRTDLDVHALQPRPQRKNTFRINEVCRIVHKLCAQIKLNAIDMR